MSAQSQMMEHRWGSRVRLDAEAELRTAEGTCLPAAVRNTSLSGAFVETTAKPAVLSRVAVRPIAKEGEWLDGWVVRVESSGIALEWLDPGVHALYVLLSSHPADSPVPGSSSTQGK